MVEYCVSTTDRSRICCDQSVIRCAGDRSGVAAGIARRPGRDVEQPVLLRGISSQLRVDLAARRQAYGQALERRPGWREATENRDRIAALIPAPKVAGRDDETARWEPNEPADEIRFDDKGKLGKQGKLELSDRQMSEIWLRGLTTSPGAFLREKFRAQNASRGPAK